MDVTHKVAKSFDYDRYTWLAIVVIAAMAFWTYGCQASTRSIVSGESVSRAEFTAEVEIKIAALEAEARAVTIQAEAGMADLARQEEARTQLLAMLQGVVTTYVPEPLSSTLLPLLGLAGLTYGLGKKADNVRKDGKLVELKDNADANKAKAGFHNGDKKEA